MTSCLPAQPESMIGQYRVPVVAQDCVAKHTYRLRFRCPELARRLQPGQFVMLRLAGWNDPLLGRPLAMYEVHCDEQGEPQDVDVVYHVLGKMTTRLAHFVAGQELDVWGPLGNGFPIFTQRRLIMAAGGIGQTPFLALGKETLRRQVYGRSVGPISDTPPQVTLLYGARSADFLAGVDDFLQQGIDVRVSTDDGSAGHAGLVTDLLRDELERLGDARDVTSVVCCGPERMMEAVSEVTQQAAVRCWVSLETPMACGIGICFTCVARVRQPDGSWDYRRTCVEGPVFEAEKISWR